jgi:signal transduction histidine kinase
VADDAAASVAVESLRPVVPLLAAGAAVGSLISDSGSAAENVVAVLAPLPFVAWGLWPRRVPGVALIAWTAVVSLLAMPSGSLESLLFLVCVAATIVGISERSRTVVIVAGACAAAIPVVVELLYDDGILYGVWVMGVLLPLVLSWGFRRQLELAGELSAARQALAHQAVLDEKQRIARDVHDLVGHGLAAVLLHVTGARHVLRRDIDAAEEALADAEAVGRRSLGELRRTLALLRTPDDAGQAHTPPVPDASDIAEVVDAARGTGVDAAFRLEGDAYRVDPIIGLSLHRVAEEALVNAQRHAPRAVTDVVLAVQDEAVVLTVESVGPLGADGDPPPASDAERPRYGLVGMRERMAAVGGELEAGPTPVGWLVRCRAPLVAEPPATPPTPATEPSS